MFENGNEKRLYLGTWAGAIDENANIWFSCFEFNGLFKFDTKTREIEFIRHFVSSPHDAKELHGRAFYYQEKVIFFPLVSEDICIFHTKTSEMITKHLTENVVSRPILVENHIYFVAENKVYKFAMDDYDLQKMEPLSSHCFEFASKASGEITVYPYSTGFVVAKRGGNMLLRIDVTSNDIEQFEIDKSVVDGIWGAYYNSGTYWLTGERSQDIIALEKEKGVYVVYHSQYEEWMTTRIIPYTYMFFSDSDIWALNYYAKNLKCINELNKSVEDIQFYKEHAIFSKSLGYGAAVGDAIENEDTIYFLPQRKKQIFIYDKKTGEYDCCEFCIETRNFDGYESLIRDVFAKGRHIDESEFGIDLKCFITYLTH